jgi:hypothetical protein
MLKIIGALALVITAVPAAAELPTIFGQPLGKPLIYPACKADGHAQKETCYRLADETTFIVEIPTEKTPSMLVINKFSGFLVNGKVEIILADTIGDWETVSHSLIDKFGQQTAVEDGKTVVAGAPTDTILISWQKPDFVVIFSTVGETPNTGKLQVITSEGQASVRRQVEELDKDKVKL